MHEGLLAVLAQYDNDQRSENTVLGMKASLRLGRWTFKAPIGYVNSKDAEGRPTIVPNPPQAALVKFTFERYATGQSKKTEVLKHVTQLGLRTNTNKKLSTQTLHKLLVNPVYYGWISVPVWGIDNKGNFEPIISRELFDTAQFVLKGKGRSHPNRSANPDFPLRVFVRCAACGKPITGSWTRKHNRARGTKKGYAYYRCRNSHCKAFNVPEEQLHREFVALLERLQPNPEWLKLFRAVVVDVWKQKQGDAAATTSALEQKLASLKEKKKRLLDAMLEGRLKQADFDEANDLNNEEIAVLEMDAHEARLVELDVEALLGYAEHVLTRAARLWFDSSLEVRQRLQTVLFPEGLAYSSTSGFGTAPTSSMFSLLNGLTDQKGSLVDLGGFEPPTPWLQTMCSPN